MSKENVEVIKRANREFNSGNLDAFLEHFVSDFQYVASGMIAGGGGVYRGREEFRRFMDTVWGEFDDLHSEITDVIDAGDRVLLALTMHGRGKQSGVKTSWSFCQVWTMRDGKIASGQGFPDQADALEAIGLPN